MKLLTPFTQATRYAKARLEVRANQKYIADHAEELFTLPDGEKRYQVALYFADQPVNLYQIRQWYEPLRRLSVKIPVTVLARLPETALRLRDECPLPIVYAPTIEDVETFVDTQRLKLVFYVNQNIRNFQMLRFNNMNHVFVSHGESEKAYMWSNQLKAYDYVFGAGEAARARLSKHLHNFDADRVRVIGRPQIDVNYLAPYSFNRTLPTVLYAPTWEGDRPSMRYGSVLTHGTALIESLIKDGGFNVIFRPHPRSGANSPGYAAEIAKLRRKLEVADSTSAGRLLYDDATEWGWQWAVSDVCITDISAVAYDFLATGKPMFVTKPTSPKATVLESPALVRAPALEEADAPNASQLIREALSGNNKEFEDLVTHYFGDVTPGASMQRFIEESLYLVEHFESSQIKD